MAQQDTEDTEHSVAPPAARARRTPRPPREGDARFNHNLRALRNASGISHRRIAEALAVSERQLYLIERGQFRASVQQLLASARLFNVSVDRFFEPIPGGTADRSEQSASARDAMIAAFRQIGSLEVQRCLLAFSRTLARSCAARPRTTAVPMQADAYAAVAARTASPAMPMHADPPMRR